MNKKLKTVARKHRKKINRSKLKVKELKLKQLAEKEHKAKETKAREKKSEAVEEIIPAATVTDKPQEPEQQQETQTPGEVSPGSVPEPGA